MLRQYGVCHSFKKDGFKGVFGIYLIVSRSLRPFGFCVVGRHRTRRVFAILRFPLRFSIKSSAEYVPGGLSTTFPERKPTLWPARGVLILKIQIRRQEGGGRLAHEVLYAPHCGVIVNAARTTGLFLSREILRIEVRSLLSNIFVLLFASRFISVSGAFPCESSSSSGTDSLAVASGSPAP